MGDLLFRCVPSGRAPFRSISGLCHHRSLLLVVSVALATCVRCHQVRAAGKPDTEALIGEYAAAGEFAPAMQLARDAPSGPQRDQFYEQIAVAQAGANMRGAAVSTATHIESNESRSRALTSISRQDAAPAFGGGAQADFDTLVNLITTTIEPDSWIDAGGTGTIDSFPTGVYVDADGLLHRVLRDDATGRLAKIRDAEAPWDGAGGIRSRSPLRKVSLTRLERHVQLLRAAGHEPSEDMKVLAGLEEVHFVMIYPESGDLVIAGPAGDWTVGEQGRIVSRETGRPVLRLDDLVVLLRQTAADAAQPFGCSIVPNQKGLAAVQQFLAETGGRQLPAGSSRRWFEQIRRRMGLQEVEYFGVDPDTRLAQVLLEADYHMKHVGIGLEQGTIDVKSYLALIDVPPGQAPPPLEMLRWWFVMDYDSVLAAADHDVFEFHGQGVKLLSENEFLAANGRRVHTGQAEPTNREFARRFTEHFDDLTAKYSIYGELSNVFDLALVASLIQAEGLADRVDWHMTCFLDPEGYEVPLSPAPRMVEPVANSRRIRGRHIVGAVAGGVRIDMGRFADPGAVQVDSAGTLSTKREGAAPLPEASRDVWWWD